MPAELSADSHLETAHVLFTDIVGYSKLPSDEQRKLVQLLNDIVRSTSQFRSAEAAGKLVRIPTGDGMVLAFFTSVDAPVRCAQQISGKLHQHPALQLRMGINSGPVDEISDVNDRPNITGIGVNIAQRVMDCGDAGHILLSRRVADDLGQYGEWNPYLHELGEIEVKHGVKVPVVNFFADGVGNPRLPQKVQRAAEERARTHAIAKRRKRKRLALVTSAAVLAVVFMAIGAWVWQRRTAITSAYKAGAAGIVEKSIAVLPFDNFGDKENVYFADGVQDDILTDLAKVADLRVIGRRSVVQYRDTKQTPREIGQALQVAYLLEGSVRRLGGRITVTAHLIDTRTEAEKWAQRYEQELSDLFSIQSQISEAIVTQLKAVVTPEEKAAIETAPTQDMQAYDLYLRAKALVNQPGVLAKVLDENRIIAIKLLQDAIARDPKFVLAYCLLSRELATPNWMEKLPPERAASAKAAAETAARIAPESGDAHLAMADVYDRVLKDRERRIQEIQIAARRMPNSADVHSALAQLATDGKHFKQALEHWQKALQIDPRNPDIAIGVALFYISLRRFDEAEALNNRTISLLQQTTRPYWDTKFQIALARGDLKAARAALDANPARDTGSIRYPYEVATLLMFEKRYAEAADMIDKIPEIAAKGGNLPRSGVLDAPTRGHFAQLKGIIFRAQGDAEKARSAFEESRQAFAESVAERSDEGFVPGPHINMAVADAALGRKEEALREAEQVIHLHDGRIPVAVVYAWTGNQEAAIRWLQEIVKTNGELTAGDLKFNPKWNGLRSDPRFAGIVEEAARPIKIE